MNNMSRNPLPRWRGFNLLDFFTTKSTGDLPEEHLKWIRGWGFDFVRFPMCYTLWIENDDVYRIHEPMLAKVDRAVELCRQYGIHCNLSFHRGPGYSVNPERDEPFNLWKDQDALDAFCFHWELFARRYRGISPARLSFNLLNEPPNPGHVAPPCYKGMERDDHERVMRAAAAAIRASDPQRLIILDGLAWGTVVLPELADLNVAQSCRAYAPMGVSHYQAPWVGGEKFPPPAWPGGWNWDGTWDRARLEAHYAPWSELVRQGVGVHCGEGGAHNKTPHDIFLRWFEDVLQILRDAGIGWALWNFCGSFGVLDSGRADVPDEDWHGHRLDRKLLELLRTY